MTELQKKLFELRDEEYAKFQAKLTPTVKPDRFIGVRVPILRKFAKEYMQENDYNAFLNSLPHEYYDENLLHGFIVSLIKDYDTCMTEVERFLPYIDNWAVSDTMSPKVFKKHRKELLEKIKIWVKSDKTYTIRFAIDMLMSHFLDEDFKEEYPEIPASVVSEEYYVNMMIAWYFATALAKQWDCAITYIENHRLSEWTHKKTIQKACESFRVSDEHKTYLRTLK